MHQHDLGLVWDAIAFKITSHNLGPDSLFYNSHSAHGMTRNETKSKTERRNR